MWRTKTSKNLPHKTILEWVTNTHTIISKKDMTWWILHDWWIAIVNMIPHSLELMLICFCWFLLQSRFIVMSMMSSHPRRIGICGRLPTLVSFAALLPAECTKPPQTKTSCKEKRSEPEDSAIQRQFLHPSLQRLKMPGTWSKTIQAMNSDPSQVSQSHWWVKANLLTPPGCCPLTSSHSSSTMRFISCTAWNGHFFQNTNIQRLSECLNLNFAIKISEKKMEHIKNPLQK